MGSEHGDDGLRRRGCSCTKDDFLPEESFKSMGNYFKALKETPSRFIDRVMTRSDDSAEIHDMKARSGNEMKKTLTWWDLMWFGVGAVICSGIFVLTGQEARERSGPAVVLSFVVSGVSAMLSVFCYTEFAVEIPVAGMTTVLLVGAIGQARYMTHIARAHMMPPWLAHVNAKTGTPINATVVMLAATALIAFFTKLAILADLLSVSTLFIFMFVAVALLVRRYYVTGETSSRDRNKFLMFLGLILASSIATAVYWAMEKDGWIVYAVTVSIWFLSTVGMKFLVPQARAPKLWGVPLVPWLPSASIAINIFLLGSIDEKSFVRFGIWTAVLLVYYFLFGLHATYDTAKATLKEKSALKNAEEGSVAADKTLHAT